VINIIYASGSGIGAPLGKRLQSSELTLPLTQINRWYSV
jgi:hypothetical protein